MNSKQQNKYLSRRQDDGWGRALAIALIPLYGLYHAVSRRTVTPLLFAIAFQILYLFIGIIVLSELGLTNNQSSTKGGNPIAGLYVLLLIPTGTLGAKLGIDKSQTIAN